jgi:predicted  nucleic acid-binding Zn-ribbon protein
LVTPVLALGLFMSKISDLYGLQEIDLEMDSKRTALADAEERMGESEEVQAAAEEVEQRQVIVDELRKRLRAAEWEVDDVASKIQPLEKRLYGGSVRNPKELADIEEDVHALQSRKRSLEDRALDVMSELEEAEKALGAAQAELTALADSWREEQADLSEQQETLKAALSGLEAQQTERRRLLDAETLTLYDALRSAHQGRAVVKVERGTCGGCRISLPMNILQKARGGGDTFVRCTSCERILYVS